MLLIPSCQCNKYVSLVKISKMKINNITQTHGTNGYKAYIWLYVQCLVIESISFRQLRSETIHVGIKLLFKSQLQKTF